MPRPDPRLIRTAAPVYRGDVHWVASPGAAAPHPHVVVQDDVLNHSRVETVVVCALTSNLRRASEPGTVALEPGEGGLERQSVVLASQVEAVPKRDLGARIGTLSGARVDQVLAAMRLLQASHFRGR